MAQGTRRLIWIAVSFLIVSTLTRIGLTVYSEGVFTFGEITRIMGIGTVFDLTVLPYFLLPWALYEAVLPGFVTRHPVFGRWEDLWAGIWGAAFLGLFITTSVSEFVFWTEFSTRFDFIAVDYLIYTHEVIRNIWQSYPVVQWLSAVLVVCLVTAWFSWPRSEAAGGTTRYNWPGRWLRVAVVGVTIPLGLVAVGQELAETESNAFVQQLSGNGFYAFGHAYQHNELDYQRYYPSHDGDALNVKIRDLVQEPNSLFTSPNGIKRTISARGPLQEVNVVLISVESLSASFLGHFGNQQNLTPELDTLADQGLLFTNLYATGTRTVRGLEALSVGTPPTPGQSIVRRPDNNNLENLGEELKDAGLQPYWIYGGYGFFDNMNAYFNANGYTVVDRSDLDAEGLPIHHETVWGVADEDLYSLALMTIDREYAKGNRFFTHVMTTSNHRPYTFPEGRIDLPQKHREGAVKYTDWAIGDFIRRSSEKPWFDNTLFIIVSDHTAKAAGKTDLPPSRYHIPMVWYAPGLIEPGTMDRLMSQIDVAPSLMGWMGMAYDSSFFGYDIFNLEDGRERAFISTYQKLGYLKGDRLVMLDVNKEPVVLDGLPASPTATAPSTVPPVGDQALTDEAIAWYQAASVYFSSGRLKEKDIAGEE